MLLAIPSIARPSSDERTVKLGPINYSEGEVKGELEEPSRRTIL
jgi:hypothetical protein